MGFYIILSVTLNKDHLNTRGFYLHFITYLEKYKSWLNIEKKLVFEIKIWLEKKQNYVYTIIKSIFFENLK